MIARLVLAIKEATGLNVYAFATPSIEECVVYNYTPLNNNGAMAQARIDLRVIAFSLADALVIQEKVINALMTPGDGSKIEGVTSIEATGGGSLVEPGSGTTQVFQSFKITMKSEVK